MKRIKNLVLAALVIVSAVVPLLFTLPTSAVSSTGTGSSSLSIEPRKDYSINPGSSVSDKIIIQNMDSKNTLNLSLRVIDFTYNGSDGTPRLMLAENAPQTTWSLKPYLSLPESVTIAPGQSKSVPLSVKIPSNVGAGSYYSAIVYSSGAGNGGNVGLSASGVTLVFVNVPGKVNERLTVQQLGAFYTPSQTRTTTGSFVHFATTKPLAIAYTLKNEGNVTESPAGSITYKWMFGKTQTIAAINPSQSLALIGQSRTFQACIKLSQGSVDFNGSSSVNNVCQTPSLWPGYYHLHLDAFYGQNGNQTQEVFADGGFWYLPWWFIVTAIIVLLVVAYFVWRAVVNIQRLLGYRPKANKYRPRR